MGGWNGGQAKLLSNSGMWLNQSSWPVVAVLRSTSWAAGMAGRQNYYPIQTRG
jgi:hypothetical protein